MTMVSIKRIFFPASLVLTLSHLDALVEAGQLNTEKATSGLSLSKAVVDFGVLALGERSNRSLQLRNNSQLPLTVAEITLEDDTNAFSVENRCSTVLPVGSRCWLWLSFTPKRLKPSHARLSIYFDDSSRSVTMVSLTGNRYMGLNDTGVVACADAYATNKPCPIPNFPNQDAEQGRDKSQKNHRTGQAGFNFTKLNDQGKTLSASAPNWSCIRDNVTGLIWESKHQPDGIQGNQGLHDGDDRFTWYSTDETNNNGLRGVENGTYIDLCYGYQAGQPVTYCNTQAFVRRVNHAGWCGAHDWRLPTRKELHGLVNHSVAYSYGITTINTAYFPDTLAHWYWTASSFAGNAQYSFIVSFTTGYSDGVSRNHDLPIRLVRDSRL